MNHFALHFRFGNAGGCKSRNRLNAVDGQEGFVHPQLLQRPLRHRANHRQRFEAHRSAGKHQADVGLLRQLLGNHDGIGDHGKPGNGFDGFGQVIGGRAGIQDNGVPFPDQGRGLPGDGLLLEAETVLLLHEGRLRIILLDNGHCAAMGASDQSALLQILQIPSDGGFRYLVGLGQLLDGSPSGGLYIIRYLLLAFFFI
ncbi:hypothetical protein D3C75_960970 [compost metagenome]